MTVKRHYGWKRQAHDPRDHKMLFSARRLATLPNHVSLARIMPQPDNQMSLGACGLATADEMLKSDMIAQKLPVRSQSRLFMYYNCRVLMGTVNEDSGVDNRTLLKSLAATGYCDEQEFWPYDIARFTQKPPPAAYDASLPNVLKNYVAVPTDLDAMKACLASGHPFMFGFEVFSGLESEACAETGICPDPKPGETAVGGHDICIWGYNDLTRQFYCTNHWGLDWGCTIDGIKGCFKISYDYATDPNYAADFWAINAITGPVSVAKESVTTKVTASVSTPAIETKS